MAAAILYHQVNHLSSFATLFQKKTQSWIAEWWNENQYLITIKYVWDLNHVLKIKMRIEYIKTIEHINPTWDCMDWVNKEFHLRHPCVPAFHCNVIFGESSELHLTFIAACKRYNWMKEFSFGIHENMIKLWLSYLSFVFKIEKLGKMADKAVTPGMERLHLLI